MLMKYFKLPLIVTAIVLPMALVFGIVATVWIFGLDISNREKADRAGMVGTGAATLGCLVIAPFWFVASAKLGKERRKKMRRR